MYTRHYTLTGTRVKTNEKDQRGSTALSILAKSGVTPAISILCATTNANPNLTDVHGRCERSQHAPSLMSPSTVFNAVPDLCRTPLHFAASRGYIDTIDTLIEAGAWLESEDK